MRAYHFVKYNETTSLQNLVNLAHVNSILCFDIEDSIQDCILPENTIKIKNKYRNYLKDILNQNSGLIGELNIGIRINPIDSSEYSSDLLLLSEIKQIHTIFLPKTDNALKVQMLYADLLKNNIIFKEIIPVIETKNGTNNLDNIARGTANLITRIAFGHCDYNLDNNLYPFFHQNSREYWSWIVNIYQVLKHYKLNLVNSPFLELGNDEQFQKTLEILYSVCGDNCDQITLSKKQTHHCSIFFENSIKTRPSHLKNKLDMRVDEYTAEEYIKSFERNTNDKGFALNEFGTVLSPQEYKSAIEHQKKKDLPQINFTFVGGCFPVQGNIHFEDLFHQLIKKQVESEQHCKFNINIIRYERFRNCLDKISTYHKENPIDILVFSVRPEPFLRLLKIFYRYIDISTGRKRWSFNLLYLNKLNPENTDLLSLEGQLTPGVLNERSGFRKLLIDLNYCLGWLIGNNKRAMRQYFSLINEIIDFGTKNNITIEIIGPPVRSFTFLESIFSGNLDRAVRKSIPTHHFVSGADLEKQKEILFHNGIYATKEYHELIAERLLNKMRAGINATILKQKTSAKTEISN